MRTRSILRLPGLVVAALAAAAPAAGQAKAAGPTLPPYLKFQTGEHVLVDSFKYQFPSMRRPVVVPAGFVTDFASIPGPVQWAFRNGFHDMPALVHDYMYWSQRSKREADLVFRNTLRDMRLPQWQVMAMYAAVELAGSSAWAANCKDRRAGLPRVIPREHMAIPANVSWRDYRLRLRRMGVKLDPSPDHLRNC